MNKQFTRKSRVVTAISDLSFDVQYGEYVCVLGRSGCGKSTSVNLILGLDSATSGTVRVLGVDPWKDFGKLKGQIGCVFQGDRMLPWRSVLDNVRLPLEILGIDESSLDISPVEWLVRIGLGDFLHAYPYELSGGMRQRAAMARALVSDPVLLLADEAFGNLDEVTAAALRGEFRQIARQRSKTVLQITHSIDEALAVGDRIIVLGKPGQVAGIIENVKPSDVAARERTRSTILSLIEDAVTVS
ncbi:ABC transporter ATP-binding protein [Caballeronia sp. DA-9]|uniref:ABC transporter ATP-binding protein n=1 Tax=Caballeronia sp. DA-9 TaxID=3436237 RepID=UPI003F6630D4